MRHLMDSRVWRFLFPCSFAMLGVGWLAARGTGEGFGAPPVGAELAVPPPSTGEGVSRRQFDYFENEGSGRVLADVTAVLRVSDGVGRLRVTVSAIGPNVDPVPGFRGVQGANLVTAMELERLLETDALAVQIQEKASGRVACGSYGQGLRGRVPLRRLLADGEIDFQAESDEEYPLELIADSGDLGSGDYEMNLLAAGKPRLAIVFRIGKDAAGIGEMWTRSGP